MIELLKRGADVNRISDIPEAHQESDESLRDANGGTALIGAASSGHEKIVKALLVYGADTHVATPNGGRTALSVAEELGQFPAVKVLKHFLNHKNKRVWRASKGATLKSYLQKNSLDAYLEDLQGLGVEEPADLLELDEDDFSFMKKLHRKKYLTDALEQLRGDPPGVLHTDAGKPNKQTEGSTPEDKDEL